jgi:hypothetical protein
MWMVRDISKYFSTESPMTPHHYALERWMTLERIRKLAHRIPELSTGDTRHVLRLKRAFLSTYE